ncbi:hypothetical protein [Azospirillum sp. TSO22-1]|uniref:hypothetical protein n=1 Tax=Azospirillum sp. TSO22-1 TaxID=716789 RepID=UPI000D622680|nr:hypothetical protein [Azospirillum sp. TSO22-1]PWC45760.1 hypothetical protein TSO221_15830 [Azospirillum sp. TSO22-1]
MRLILYAATAFSVMNTVVLLLTYLWQSSERALAGASSSGMTVYGLTFVLSFAIAVMLCVYVYIGRR